MVLARGAALVAVLGLAVAILVVAAGPLLGNDIWWHLAMGEVYATEGPWPGADPLLHTAHVGAPVQHEWLFGVAVHGVEQAFGFGGLRVFHGLAVVAILGMAGSVLRRASGALEPACLATAAFAVLAWWRLIQLRPDLVSILATLVLWRLVLEPREPPSRQRVAACVALLALWANLHSLFAIGLLLLGAGLVGVSARTLMLRRLGAHASAARERARGRRLGATLGLGFLATLANPRGIEQHLTFLRSSSESGIWRITDEWRPFPLLGLEGRLPSLGVLEWALGLALLVLLPLAVAAAARGFLREPSERILERADPVRLALGAASVVAFLVSIRFLWLGVFALLYVLHVARGAEHRACWSPARRAAGAAFAAALALGFPLASSYALVLANLPLGSWWTAPYAPAKYPVAAVELLCEAGLEGELFNSYGEGGFLGYWLAPRLRTFVDSRTEHYPAEVLEDYLRIKKRRGAGDLPGILDRYGVDVFLGTGYPTSHARAGMDFTGAHLEGEPGWVLVSRGVGHAVWLRRDPANEANLARIAAFWSRRGIPFDPRRGLDPTLLVESHAAWAARRGLVPGDLPRILAGRRSDDPAARFRALDRLSLVLALLGAHVEAIEGAREALTVRPAAAGPRRRLVYALLRTRRPAEARAVLGDDPGAARQGGPLRRLARWVERYEQVVARDGDVAGQALLDRFPLLSSGEERWILADRAARLVDPSSCSRSVADEGPDPRAAPGAAPPPGGGDPTRSRS